MTQGQAAIDEGQYDRALLEFSALIEAQPTEFDGYRGRAEASLLLGRYADAYCDYYAGITAFVLPRHPHAATAIDAHYAARLAADPQSIPALTGASFAHWVFVDYAGTIHLLDDLLAVRPDDVFGTLFRGSARVLAGVDMELGIADLERAIELAPDSPDVHYVVADAFAYGAPDPDRAYAEASIALEGGLDTPRVQAILAFGQLAVGNDAAAANHIERHIALVTRELLTTPPLEPGTSLELRLVPGRVYDVPLPAVAGSTISAATSSPDFVDTIAVLYAPDGTALTGSDDTNASFAAIAWPAAVTGTFRLRTSSFEAVDTGVLTVTRD
jgi:tetratricopeptide (TPR) repeat protein